MNLVNMAIDALEPEEREIVNCLYRKNMSMREVAREISLSKSAVFYRKKQVLIKILKLLEVKI